MASRNKSKEEKKEKKEKKRKKSNKEAAEETGKSADEKTPKKQKKEKEAAAGAKSSDKKKKKAKTKNINVCNGSDSDVREVTVISNSSGDCDDDERGKCEERNKMENGSSKSSSKTKNGGKKKRKAKNDDNDDGDDGEDGGLDGSLYKFPMARIKRIIQSEDGDSKISTDAVLLVNKATEMFLEQFCEESHEYMVRDRRKALAYKYLSSVVSKRRRYDFLSDFVPSKLKAEDALLERTQAETGKG